MKNPIALLIVMLSLGTTTRSSNRNERFHIALIFSFIETFTGGIIRDIFLLKTSTEILTKDAYLLGYLILPVISFYLAKKCLGKSIFSKKMSQWILMVLSFSDTFATVKFVSYGVTKGITYGASFVNCIACGVVSSVGGGVLSKVLHREDFKQMIKQITKIIFVIQLSILFFFNTFSSTLLSYFVISVFVHFLFHLIEIYKITLCDFISFSNLLFPWIEKQRKIMMLFFDITKVPKKVFQNMKKAFTTKVRKSVKIPIKFGRKNKFVIIY